MSPDIQRDMETTPLTSQYPPEPHPEPKYSGIGIAIGVASATCYTMAALFCKLLTNTIDPISISFIRSITLSFLFIMLMIIKLNRFWVYSKREYMAIAVLGLIDIAVVVCQYFAFQMLHLADAFALLATSPIFISFITCLITNHRFDWLQIFAVFSCVIGLILCLIPHIAFHTQIKNENIGYLFALGASFGWGLTYILSRFVEEVPVYVLMSFQSIIGVIVTGIYLLCTQSLFLPDDMTDIVNLSLTSIFSFVAIFFIILALQKDTPLMASIGRNWDIIFGLILDICLFGRVPNIFSITGALLVFLGITVPAILKGTQDTSIYHMN